MPTPIPADIWLCIARFIPQGQLRRMFSVNSVFLQLAMDSRYRGVYLSTYNDITMKIMPRLRDPAVAHRVHRLTVDLDAGVDILDSNAWTYTQTSLDEVIGYITDTVTKFINVREFSAEWYIPPDEELRSQFLTAAWNTFGSGLRKLTFNVTVENWPVILSSCTQRSFTQLQTLNVSFKGVRGLTAAESAALVHSLTQFVNKVAPTLRSLYLFSTRFELELAPFLSHVETIPNLELFRISFRDSPTDLDRSVHLSSLDRFLRNHAGIIRRLLWPSPSPIEHLTDGNGSVDPHEQEQRTADWLHKNGLVDVFSNLLELDVPAPRDPYNFPLILPCIRLSERTLTSLSLDGAFLSVVQMNTLLRILASPGLSGILQKLSFNLEWLSPEVIVLLALRLPRLENLHIRYNLMIAQSGATQETPKNIWEELVLAKKFSSVLRTFDFGAWPLRHLTILKSTERFDLQFNSKLAALLAECVPSVQTLSGYPKESNAGITF